MLGALLQCSGRSEVVFHPRTKLNFNWATKGLLNLCSLGYLLIFFFLPSSTSPSQIKFGEPSQLLEDKKTHHCSFVAIMIQCGHMWPYVHRAVIFTSPCLYTILSIHDEEIYFSSVFFVFLCTSCLNCCRIFVLSFHPLLLVESRQSTLFIGGVYLVFFTDSHSFHSPMSGEIKTNIENAIE